MIAAFFMCYFFTKYAYFLKTKTPNVIKQDNPFNKSQMMRGLIWVVLSFLSWNILLLHIGLYQLFFFILSWSIFFAVEMKHSLSSSSSSSLLLLLLLLLLFTFQFVDENLECDHSNNKSYWILTFRET